MLTLDQIREAHAKVKSGADFPHYIQDLIVLGLQKYDIFVHDGHGEYFSAEGDTLVSPPKYDTLTVADTSEAKGFTERLRAHQQGETNYMTFCQDAANTGVEKWTVDTTAMTCTYYGKAGEMILEEKIPLLFKKISNIHRWQKLFIFTGLVISTLHFSAFFIVKLITLRDSGTFGLYSGIPVTELRFLIPRIINLIGSLVWLVFTIQVIRSFSTGRSISNLLGKLFFGLLFSVNLAILLIQNNETERLAPITYSLTCFILLINKKTNIKNETLSSFDRILFISVLLLSITGIIILIYF